MLKLWGSKLHKFNKRKEEESERDKVLKVNKYVVILRRNKEELEELQPILRESRNVIVSGVELEQCNRDRNRGRRSNSRRGG